MRGDSMNSKSHKSSLEVKLKSAIQDFKNSLDDYNWKEPEFYKNFLAQTYYYVSHSTRLLALSSGLTSLDKNGALYHNRSIKHMSEEFNHHYMALSDLKKLGGDINHIHEFHSTKNLYQSQYYLIQHHSPYALLGYILFLEAASTQISDLVNMLREHYGKQCCVFLSEHLELDSGDDGHLEKALEMVSKLTEHEQDVIADNIELSLFNYKSLLDECESYAIRNYKKVG